MVVSKGKSIMIKILVMILIIFFIAICYKCGIFRNYDSNSIKNYINSFGILAPIIYIIMFTLVPLTFFPDSILAISGGMAFGLFYGTVYTIIGAVFGATLSFYIARFLGRDFVNKLVHGKGKWFEDGVEKRGFFIVLMLRLIPLVPFDVISYGSGLSKIKFKDFLFGTIIGIIPGVLIFTNLGDKCIDTSSSGFIISIALLILLFVFSYIMKKKISFKNLQENIVKE
ncbi:TVP38/TMEM64 family protein [Clostridium sp. OS1-26]|nr:TVP38/TMEM64 family protein [Clostridium sp. OS1-26]WML33974.1 TVP38/TMEM64 family protein [Clostridium sp. OS1-26]